MCPFPHAMSHTPSCPPEFWFIWAHLLTYPLGARFLPLAPRACLRRVRSTVRVPNRHCALFTLICLTQKRYVTNQCASWGVTHCPPSMELYPGDTLVACNYTGEANDFLGAIQGYVANCMLWPLKNHGIYIYTHGDSLHTPASPRI